MFQEYIKKLITQFSKFVLVGILATIVNYGSFYILFHFLSVHYLIASASGFMAGVLAGYPLNRIWTFQAHDKKRHRDIVKYYSVYVVSLSLSLLFLKITVGVFGIDPRIANIFAIGLTTCTNFLGLKFIVFR